MYIDIYRYNYENEDDMWRDINSLTKILLRADYEVNIQVREKRYRIIYGEPQEAQD